MPIPKLRNEYMPFGKHKGKVMEEVPAEYLLWLYDKGDLQDGSVKKYIERNIKGLRKEVEDSNIDRMDSGEVEHF